MNLDRDAIKTAVRAKVIELANNLGMDASDIGDDDIIPAVAPDEKLKGNDHLVFAGIVETIVDLQKRMKQKIKSSFSPKDTPKSEHAKTWNFQLVVKVKLARSIWVDVLL